MAPSTKKCLEALRKAGKTGANTIALTHAVGPRFGARIMELRDAGYVIERVDVPVPKRISGNCKVFVYKLVSQPKQAG